MADEHRPLLNQPSRPVQGFSWPRSLRSNMPAAWSDLSTTLPVLGPFVSAIVSPKNDQQRSLAIAGLVIWLVMAGFYGANKGMSTPEDYRQRYHEVVVENARRAALPIPEGALGLPQFQEDDCHRRWRDALGGIAAILGLVVSAIAVGIGIHSAL